MNSECISNTLDFLQLIGTLKTTQRTGWVQANVEEGFSQGQVRVESVADHSWRMAASCIIFAGKSIPQSFNENRNYNIEKMISLSVFHDLAEIITGDYTPKDNISKEQKQKLEENAKKIIFNTLSQKNYSNTFNIPLDFLKNTIEQYEKKACPESIAVKDLDILELLLQADNYECLNRKNNLDEFFSNTKDCIKTPYVKEIIKELNKRRLIRKGLL